MEPLTHFLTGACIGRAGLNRKTAYATLVTTLAAEFPDADIVTEFRGPLAGFAHHRGFTHSLIGMPFDAAVVVGCIYTWHRWRLKRGKTTPLPARWGLLFFYGLLAAASHILLDFTNNYGVRPFMPFSWRWYSWDIVFIVEPLMLAALFLGLVMPSLFSLVNQEVGAKRQTFRGRSGAIFALLCIVLIWGVRDYQHRKAVTQLQDLTYGDEGPKRVAAMPYPVNPFHWAVIVETEAAFHTMDVDSLRGVVDPRGREKSYAKPEETPVTLAAKKSWLGHVYLSWAQFPLVETEPLQRPSGGYIVRFRDLRFGYSAFGLGDPDEGPARRTPLGASVELDRNLNVVEILVGKHAQQLPLHKLD